MALIFVVILLVVLGVWITLPFIPALSEYFKPKDIDPVRVVRDSEVRATFFADGYREFMRQHLAEPVSRCLATGNSQYGKLKDGTAFAVLDGNEDREAPTQPDAVVVSCGSLRLSPKSNYPLELYARKSVVGGDGGTCRAILADEDIDLGPECTTLRWVHADRSFSAGAGCSLWGRVSSGGEIRLAADTVFERLNARRITFGESAAPAIPPPDGDRLESGDLPRVIDDSAGRWLVRGKLDVPENRRIDANLVATGSGRIGDRARITGSIKSHKTLVLGRGVVVDGNVVSRRDIQLGEGCLIRGLLLAGGSVTIQEGCVFGTPETATTVSARRAVVSPGVIVHGTFWAHEQGRTDAAGYKGGRDG
jgi:cytoskeletal protein CcmA (bactofilin family)